MVALPARLDRGRARDPVGPVPEPRHLAARAGERLLVHQEELGDRLMGVVAGYLLWSGRLPGGPQAIAVVERLIGHPMGPPGLDMVARASELGVPGAT